MIVHQTKFLLEDTTEIAVLLVKTKESLSKTSVLEVAIEAIDLEKIATEVDTETVTVVVAIEAAIEVVTEKETTAKAQIDQTDPIDPIEEVMEIEMPVVLQIEAATEIEMLVKVPIEVAIEIEEIAVKVQTEVVIEKVVEVTTAEVSEKKIAEAMVETGLEVVIVTDQKENTNHTTARMPFLIH